MQQSINGAVKAFMTFISYAENFFPKCHISILSRKWREESQHQLRITNAMNYC